MSSATNWVNFGKFTVPVSARRMGRWTSRRLADALSEGILNRLVRAQIIKGSAIKDKGKLVYQLRIDNASPLVLNGLAMCGDGEQGRRDAQGVADDQCVAAQEPDGSDRRARGQKPGTQEGDQGRGA